MTQPLTLGQALGMLATSSGEPEQVFLICGAEPLHLATFLRAYANLRLPGRSAAILTGVYGDLRGTLDKACQSQASVAAVVIEWSDLDPRLGLRAAGGWGPSVEQDILDHCREGWSNLLEKLEALAERMPVAVSPPTLAPPLLGHTPGWRMSAIEAELLRDAAAFAADAARGGRIRVLHPARLAQESPASSRLDPKMELAAGFPYSVPHASALARQLVQLLYPPAPLKGLITDLDDTFWSGLLGETGAEGVHWSLADGAQLHGLYQQLLRQFSEIGVLLGIASKNEPAVVEAALRREDLYVPGGAFFPVKAGWAPKSQSVAAILETWNVGPESVVFIDDQPMELAEVQTAFPSMTCLPFPTASPAKALALFGQLRDLFGKAVVQPEDTLRQTSIRAHAQRPRGNGFVRELRGRLTLNACEDRTRERLLELINKTNQFNLNGQRISEAEWLRHLQSDDAFAIGVSYEDRFGPLGVIGVIAGHRRNGCAEVTSWVLSCRAFSRNIEHHMLHYVARKMGAERVVLAFQPTERNGYLREFLTSLGFDATSTGALEAASAGLTEQNLPHEVRIGGEDR